MGWIAPASSGDPGRTWPAARKLDEPADDPKAPTGKANLRWVYIHLLEEYAQHTGHADLIRERIDGFTGVVNC